MRAQGAVRTFGYYFHPAREEDAVGYSRLDITIRDQPTHQHYDPESVRIPVLTDRGEIQEYKIAHPWALGNSLDASAGRVELRDRKGEAIHAFTFGGQLEIQSGHDATMCSLKSPAPILHLILDEPTRLGHNPQTLLALEVEALLARRRASWVSHLTTYQERLAALDPLALYIASLRSMSMRFEDFPSAWKSANVELLNLIHSELSRLGKRSVDSQSCQSLDDLV